MILKKETDFDFFQENLENVSSQEQEEVNRQLCSENEQKELSIAVKTQNKNKE